MPPYFSVGVFSSFFPFFPLDFSSSPFFPSLFRPYEERGLHFSFKLFNLHQFFPESKEVIHLQSEVLTDEKDDRFVQQERHLFLPSVFYKEASGIKPNIMEELMVKNTHKVSLFIQVSYLNYHVCEFPIYLNFHQLFIKIHLNYHLIPFPTQNITIIRMIGKRNNRCMFW